MCRPINDTQLIKPSIKQIDHWSIMCLYNSKKMFRPNHIEVASLYNGATICLIKSIIIWLLFLSITKYSWAIVFVCRSLTLVKIIKASMAERLSSQTLYRICQLSK